MLSKETNELGVITLNEALVNQLLSEAIKPWESKARYVGERQIRFGDDGLYVYAALSLRIGSSITEIAGGILNYMTEAAANCLELSIEDIIIEVVQMTTSRNAVKREIRFSYRGSENE